jgi:hypothetical protein
MNSFGVVAGRAVYDRAAMDSFALFVQPTDTRMKGEKARCGPRVQYMHETDTEGDVHQRVEWSREPSLLTPGHTAITST